MDSEKKAWVISVDMGYGHQRAANPLRDIAYERIITANSDKITTPKEKRQWLRLQSFYERISRFRYFPIVGKYIWRIYDKFQSISPYYPFRDLSKPTLPVVYIDRLIRKGFVRGMIDYIKKKKLPLVSPFFVPPIAASYAGLKDLYCIVTDTDINRVWVPRNPKEHNIYYFTPTEHSTKRLMAYGVNEKNIFFTGFPLPEENLGENLKILKKDLASRLVNLDPNKIYIRRYKSTLEKMLGKLSKPKKKRPLTLTFAVGGAGAQKGIATKILRSLENKIREHKIRLNLVAGIRLEISSFFMDIINELNLQKEVGRYINILRALDKKTYFEEFNKALRETDILWTKPSELSFFTALGLPIIIAPPLGAHETFNEKWLMQMGSGFQQEDPCYVNEWLFDWLRKGMLAEAAWEGFTEAPKFGTENIKRLIFAKDKSEVKLRY